MWSVRKQSDVQGGECQTYKRFIMRGIFLFLSYNKHFLRKNHQNVTSHRSTMHSYDYTIVFDAF